MGLPIRKGFLPSFSAYWFRLSSRCAIDSMKLASASRIFTTNLISLNLFLLFFICSLLSPFLDYITHCF